VYLLWIAALLAQLTFPGVAISTVRMLAHGPLRMALDAVVRGLEGCKFAREQAVKTLLLLASGR
jgi:hypothetical protein